MEAHVLFAGETHRVTPDSRLSIGREADLVVDENPYLHRRFLEVFIEDDLVWVENVGTQLAARLSDEHGLMETFLAPGSRVPIVLERVVVWFTAGPTTYDFEVVTDRPAYTPVRQVVDMRHDTTRGHISMTPDQRLLVVALAEEFLRRGVSGRATVPASAVSAERLGWTMTKFNRKLDNVCEKLAKQGVRGLVPDGGRNASTRRARLVEYALAVRLVTPDDLVLLDRRPGGPPSSE